MHGITLGNLNDCASFKIFDHFKSSDSYLMAHIGHGEIMTSQNCAKTIKIENSVDEFKFLFK